MGINLLERTILDGVAATGAGSAFNVEDVEYVTFIFGSASSANATTKFAGSASKAAPDFDSAASVANHWDFLDVVDMEDGSSIDGDTGIALSGTDDIRLLSANVKGLSWVSANVTARSAGNITVKVSGYNYNRR